MAAEVKSVVSEQSVQNVTPIQEDEIVLRLENNEPVVSSREIAERFDKRHDHVVRDIEEIQRGSPKIGDTPLFHKTSYIHPQNGQSYHMYLMNRDGFTLLAMGFTGKKAFEWKLKYISAFNKMERQLAARSEVSAQLISDLNNQLVSCVQVLNVIAQNQMNHEQVMNQFSIQLADIERKSRSNSMAIDNITFFVKGNQNRLDEINTKIQQASDLADGKSVRTFRSYTPQPSRGQQEPKATSLWRHDVFEISKNFAKLEGLPQNAIFKKVYDQMNRIYGWYFKDARKAYIEKTGYKGDISKISGLDVIEDSDMYRSIFKALLTDMYEASKKEAKECSERTQKGRMPDERPVLIPADLIPQHKNKP